MSKVTTLNTKKQNRADEVKQGVAAVNQLSTELSAVVVFGKCADGTFVTLTANTMEPEMLGYSYSQLNYMSIHLAQLFEGTAENVQLPEVE